MTKRMLIDATHPEETRVAVVSGNRLEEYDFETMVRKQLKSNIYLVKVTRVEPSLQAAFVDFGGNRHGFLPFPEIHPDYYRIPIADREALLAEERALAAAQAAREDEEDAAELAAQGESLDDDGEDDEAQEEAEADSDDEGEDDEQYVPQHTGSLAADMSQPELVDGSDDEDEDGDEEQAATQNGGVQYEVIDVMQALEESRHEGHDHDTGNGDEGEEAEEDDEEEENLDSVGGDTTETPAFRSSIKRRYKIQEVIKRNQIMLIQISKEERGNKGAAVTSYISLPGRYCVLMPNSPRGGGVSRKVSNAKDRQRLKAILRELNVPEGMSVILRTAGVARTTAEIKRDLDYLLRLWDQIRELTLKSTAPALIYEEGSLIKRAIRDLYKREIDEIHVSGEEGFNSARDFMKMLMPSHVEKVHHYNDASIPLFFRYQVESQIDAIHSPTVHLKSGGYIVINPTEALVSIDVNSGRATKGRHIEETALKTNIEAAEEIARQLRLRDQGGLIVIDFIDMEDRRGNRIVEKKLRDAMQSDRARIQLGRISAFGLLELSRQRLHPSLVESNFETCKHCAGTGLMRTVETTGVIVLRAIEEEGLKGRASEIKVSVPADVALYIFNYKRDMLAGIEKRYNIRVYIHADDRLIRPAYNIEALRQSGVERVQRAPRHMPVQGVSMDDADAAPGFADDSYAADDAGLDAGDASEGGEERQGRGSRDRGDRDERGRRRRGGRNRGRGRDRDRERGPRHAGAEGHDEQSRESEDMHHLEAAAEGEGFEQGATPAAEGGEERPGRRRGRRGGRRRGGRNRRDGAANGDAPQGESAEGGESFAPRQDNNDPAPRPERQERAERPERQERREHHDNGQQQQAARHDSHGDAGGDSSEAAAGGNRKGWWKRLTE